MSDRLELALQAYLEYDAEGESQEEFLRRHPELRDLLEPMFGEESDSEDSAPTTLGDFRILHELGRGGMGVVYVARQLSLDRRVALKVLAAHMTLQPAAIARFKQEAQTAARLQHNNMVEVLAVGSEGDNHYFAMELIEGLPLDQWCVQHEPDLLKRVAMCRDIALALHDAHRQGVIHRDVKPSNILVDETGKPHLSDFGLAREAGLPSLTATGAFAGTPYYVSPEQARGASGVDARTDVFSLGVSLYEICCGNRPFEARTSAAVLHKIQVEDPRPSADLPKDLSAIILRALEKDIGRRYPSALALAEDLQAFLEHRPVQARHLGNLQRLQRWAKRRPAVAGLSLALLLTTCLSFAWILNSNRYLRGTLRELRQLSDVRLADGFLEKHNHMQAGRPENLPLLDTWLADVEVLLSRAAGHRQWLERVRTRALPYTPEDRRRDREQAEHLGLARGLVTDMRNVRTVLDKYKDRPDKDARMTKHLASLRQNLANMRALQERIQPDLDRRRTWKFDGFDDIWLHDNLAKLIASIDRLVDPESGTYTLFKRKRDLIRDFDSRYLKPHRVAWQQARKEIAADPRFAGLRLEPQFGLVPLGKDPTSGLWEFGHPMSGTLPERNEQGRLQMTPESCLVFVLIPGGETKVGAEPPKKPENDGQHHFDKYAAAIEAPIRKIELEPYFLSKFEMTQGQWHEVLGRRPSRHKSGHRTGRVWNTDLHPVETVSWVTCEEVMRVLALRLPSEVEWEHAARAGTHTPWFVGNDLRVVVINANMADKSFQEIVRGTRETRASSHNDGYGAHSPVDRFPANPMGLHGILGNVSEWCGDLRPSVHQGAVRRVRTDDRVARGGCYLNLPQGARHSQRHWAGRWDRVAEFGLRPARSVEPGRD